MLRSMTGFGRCLVENALCSQQWEIRSVNGRYLDIKWRLPVVARHLEASLEKLVRRHAQRGRLDILLALQFSSGHAPRPVFDSQQAKGMLDCLQKLAIEQGHDFRPDYNMLLGLAHLWADPEMGQDDDLLEVIQKGLGLALEDWNEARETEGAALGMDMQSRILRLEEWTELIGERAPAIKEERITTMRERIAEMLGACNIELEEGRFLQEITILMDRLDVSEELTRLNTHLERMRQLLAEGTDVGKKLDFTLQECFREINTCGNKIQDAQLARIVVDFKNELEKCREQAQNLE